VATQAGCRKGLSGRVTILVDKSAEQVHAFDPPNLSRHSVRTVRTQRSANAFAFGARGGILTTSIPAAANTASKAATNFASRSRISMANRSACWSRSISRFRAAWVTQAPVGWAVTPARPTVSTVRTSQARAPAAWARRNCVQLGPPRRGAGPRRCRRRMLRTDVAETFTPSLRYEHPRVDRCRHRGSRGRPAGPHRSPPEGKDDELDAISAARAAVQGRRTSIPKLGQDHEGRSSETSGSTSGPTSWFHRRSWDFLIVPIWPRSVDHRSKPWRDR